MKRQTQDYYIEAAMIPNFMDDEEKAKSAIKTVLGIITSKLGENAAREFTSQLPDYLTYENLRGHQANITGASPEDCVEILADNLELEHVQAKTLMMKIIAETKTQVADQMDKIMAQLSKQWQETIDKA